MTATPVETEIRRLIAERGTIPFRDFMQVALFHPGDGYYTRPGATTGAAGDFATSSDVSPAFGRRLAVQAADAWERLGRGAWQLVELGPGRGLLLADLLEGLAELAPDAAAALDRVALVEISPALADEQRRRLERLPAAMNARVEFLRHLGEIATGSIRGVVIGNEFLDALPVHLLVRRGDALRERCVTVDADGGLTWTDGDLSDPRLADRALRYGLCAEDGWQGEVCLELEPVMAGIARVLARGAVVFVDYGHPAVEMADELHSDGTLVGYHHHAVELDLLARPGRQDLTAHVNWDHLADAAREAGFTVAGRAAQDRFLLALGVVADLMADPESADREPPSITARRLAARSLVLPGAGGGKRFEAVLLAKDIDPAFRGLRGPEAWG